MAKSNLHEVENTNTVATALSDLASVIARRVETVVVAKKRNRFAGHVCNAGEAFTLDNREASVAGANVSNKVKGEWKDLSHDELRQKATEYVNSYRLDEHDTEPTLLDDAADRVVAQIATKQRGDAGDRNGRESMVKQLLSIPADSYPKESTGLDTSVTYADHIRAAANAILAERHEKRTRKSGTDTGPSLEF